jgi:hypothetical protein
VNDQTLMSRSRYACATWWFFLYERGDGEFPACGWVRTWMLLLESKAPWEDTDARVVGNWKYFTSSCEVLPNSKKMGWHFASPFLLIRWVN